MVIKDGPKDIMTMTDNIRERNSTTCKCTAMRCTVGVWVLCIIIFIVVAANEYPKSRFVLFIFISINIFTILFKYLFVFFFLKFNYVTL